MYLSEDGAVKYKSSEQHRQRVVDGELDRPEDEERHPAATGPVLDAEPYSVKTEQSWELHWSGV